MALTLGDNFSYQGAKPLDARLKYDTLANMKAVADATMYEGCLAYCEATDKTYQWKSTNTVDADTGKWREFSSGGGGASALSELTDTNISTPTDGQVLQYDGTNDEWVNGDIEEVVKGYGYSSAPMTDPSEFVAKVKTLLNRDFTDTNNLIATIPSSYMVSCMAAGGSSGDIYIFFANANMDSKFATYTTGRYYIYLKTVNSSGNYMIAVVRNGNVIDVASYAIPTSYSDYVSSLVCSGLKILASNDITLTNDTDGEYYSINISGQQFTLYYDQSHTQPITPNTTSVYQDITTGNLYTWNGTEYVLVGTTDYTELENLPTVNSVTITGILTNADLGVYGKDDTAETGVDDADYFPFYDSSATGMRKSLWSNIKSVLKTYFDTIYSTFSGSYDDLTDKPTIVSSRETPASGGTTLSLVNTGDMYSWNNKANAPTVLSQTLSAGSTSVTFTDVPTSGNYLITPYTSVVGLDYDTITQSGSTVTVTYTAQSSNITVFLKIEGV